jgi:hypothetical protein
MAINRKKNSVRIVPLSKLVLDDKNANTGTRRGREMLSDSLRAYGAGRAVLVDRNNRVIAGNKTVEAARAAGMKSIAVIESDGDVLVAVQRRDVALNSKRGRELAIADNRVAEIGLEWNPDVLPTLNIDLNQFWYANELRGILGEKPLEAPAAKLDKAAELERKWRTRRGQIWEIGKHRLMRGSSTEQGDVAALMAGEKARICARPRDRLRPFAPLMCRRDQPQFLSPLRRERCRAHRTSRFHLTQLVPRGTANNKRHEEIL